MQDGWFIYPNPEGNHTSAKDLVEVLDFDFKTFALTGPFGSGKTFITNMLAKTGLLSGETLHTLGISIYKTFSIVFIDTAGNGNPVKNDPEFILDWRLTDFFIEEVVKDTA